MPAGLVIADEIAFRQERLAKLAKAKAVLEARAQERYDAEQAAYDAKVREREATSRQTGSDPRGRPPTPPTPGPRDKDQYNFTDPESRIMKNSNNDGFDQHYNAQAAVEQASFLIVASTLSNHPNDQAEAIPTLDAIPLLLGKPQAGALDNGYFSATKSRPWKRVTLSRTSPPGEYPIIPGGSLIVRSSPRHRQRMPVRRYRWPTNSKPRLAVRSTAYENVQSNRC